MPFSPIKISNHLLNGLPNDVFVRLEPKLELISLEIGKVLYESEVKLQYVYFPTTSIISIHNNLEDGSSLEVLSIGNESVLGLSTLMGGDSVFNLAVVHTAGHSYRIKNQAFENEFQNSPALMKIILRHAQAQLGNMAQNAACNRYHKVEQQLCRWLLSTLDRLPSDELVITQELISKILGVRREGITEASGKLQRAGFISNRRGHITVLDRAGLETMVCECYHALKCERQRLLGHN